MTNVRLAQPGTSPSEVVRTLPPELLAEASWRLGWLGLIYAVSGVVGHFGRRLLLLVTGTIEPGLRIQEAFGLAAIAMGIAVYVIARRGRLSSKRLLDLGLVFQVAGAFGIAASEFWDGVPGTLGTFTLVPAECVWIVAFPLVVPNTPNRILVSSLLAATAGPAAVALSSALTGQAVDRPLALAVYFLTSNYLCAVVAYAVSRIVYRMGARLTRAREIGSYELVERIGEGGMGEVWRAKHRLLARPAAIKLIRADVLGTSQRSREAIIRRFEREAQDTSTLGSTHTIDVYDFGITEDGDFYYVMELLNGISLDRAVREFGPLEPARAVHLLRQVCHSLGEAHGHGLIHRDIKPANIFMCRLGPDDDFVKVLDFGLVKHFEAAADGSMLTMEGVTAGTPGYMAPEIALGHAGVDGRADIYSLGCVAYYLLTGQPVFSGETPVATVLAHVQAQPVPPSARTEILIPSSLDSLILECLAKEPGARPATATVLAQRLAGTVAAAGWTEDDARQWWDLHHVSLAGPGIAPRGEVAEEPSGKTEPRQRCWPKLDSTPKF